MNKHHELELILAFSAFILLNLGSSIYAFDSEASRSTLRGIKGVHVYVEPLKPENIRGGLTDYQIQVDTELKLRTAGIRMLSENEWLTEKGNPYLYVYLHIQMQEAQSFYIGSIMVELRQNVFLARDPSNEKLLSTWSTGVLCWGPMDTYKEHIRKAVKDQMDIFVNAYLSANPK